MTVFEKVEVYCGTESYGILENMVIKEYRDYPFLLQINRLGARNKKKNQFENHEREQKKNETKNSF